jgi:hypothetical protein
MSFESRVIAFSERFLSSRSYQLIVAPALADLEFEESEQGRSNRFAVMRALAGAVRIDAAQHASTFLILTLVPAGYYFVLIAVCFDFFSGRVGKEGVMLTVARVAAPLLLMSLAPVTVCFWPDRRVARSTD